MDRVLGSHGSVAVDGMLFEAVLLRALACDAPSLVGFSVAIPSLILLFKTVMPDPSGSKGPAGLLHRTCGVVHLDTCLLGTRDRTCLLVLLQIVERSGWPGPPRSETAPLH